MPERRALRSELGEENAPGRDNVSKWVCGENLPREANVRETHWWSAIGPSISTGFFRSISRRASCWSSTTPAWRLRPRGQRRLPGTPAIASVVYFDRETTPQDHCARGPAMLTRCC